jgi:hypothetical protein
MTPRSVATNNEVGLPTDLRSTIEKRAEGSKNVLAPGKIGFRAKFTVGQVVFTIIRTSAEVFSVLVDNFLDQGISAYITDISQGNLDVYAQSIDSGNGDGQDSLPGVKVGDALTLSWKTNY